MNLKVMKSLKIFKILLLMQILHNLMTLTTTTNMLYVSLTNLFMYYQKKEMYYLIRISEMI